MRVPIESEKFVPKHGTLRPRSNIKNGPLKTVSPDLGHSTSILQKTFEYVNFGFKPNLNYSLNFNPEREG